MSNKSKIIFLLKFVSQQEYAETLCDGNLFMHSSNYYQQTPKQGQGDIREAAIFDGYAIYRGGPLPIYCLSSIYQKNIVKNKIIIDKRMVTEFGCENGFVVLIDYKEFINRLKSIETNGKIVLHQPVSYKNKSFEVSKNIFLTNSLEHLFIKTPSFSYQQEYRIVVCDPLNPRFEEMVDNGLNIQPAYYDRSVTYKIPNGLNDITKVFSIKTLEIDDDYVYIPL